MTRTYQTKNIEQAATIQSVTDHHPEISFDEAGIATFTFPLTPAVTEVVMQYENGLQADARKLLTTRNMLFKRIRGGAR
jgi:hypothetical protein